MMGFFAVCAENLQELPSIFRQPGLAGPPASQQDAQRFRPSKDSRFWHFCGKIFLGEDGGEMEW